MKSELTTYSDNDLYLQLAGEPSQAVSAALMELYRRYGQRIYTYSRKILGDSHTAEDVTQEVFTQLYKAGAAGDAVLNLPSYIYRIARNQCITYRKRISSRFVGLDDFEMESHDVAYENKELQNLITTSLELLPEDYREALVLHEYNGCSYEEIAEILNISLDLVKVRIFRAKKKLRELLSPYIEDIQEQ